MNFVLYGYQVKELLILINEMNKNILNLFLKPIDLRIALFPVLLRILND